MFFPFGALSHPYIPLHFEELVFPLVWCAFTGGIHASSTHVVQRLPRWSKRSTVGTCDNEEAIAWWPLWTFSEKSWLQLVPVGRWRRWRIIMMMIMMPGKSENRVWVNSHVENWWQVQVEKSFLQNEGDGSKHQKGRDKGSLHSKGTQWFITPSLYLC